MNHSPLFAIQRRTYGAPYAIVFSGVYSSRADAEAALTSARATGFGTAYTREVSR